MEVFLTSRSPHVYAASPTPLPEGAIRIFDRLHVAERMPFVIDDQGCYLSTVNAFLRELPSWGCSSEHTWRAYAYDLVGLCEFLQDRFPPRDLLDASSDDIRAYRNARRQGEDPIGAVTWNRSLAAFEKFYDWAQRRELCGTPPFEYRKRKGRFGEVVQVNTLYEPVGTDDAVKCVSLDDYKMFRDVGLRGMLPDRITEDPEFDRRNSERNALMADLLVNTGMRITEFVSLLRVELPVFPGDPRTPDGRAKLARWENEASAIKVAPATGKRRKGRTVLAGNRLIRRIWRYCEEDRRGAVANGFERGTFEDLRMWDRVRELDSRRAETVGQDSSPTLTYRSIEPKKRRRLLVVDRAGQVVEPAAIWLGENGRPMSDDNVRMIFSRASQRCERVLGRPLQVSPHTLRHTFAVHMLSLLVREHLGIFDVSSLCEARERQGDDLFRAYALNPLRVLKNLMGHKSVETTFGYLTHMTDVRRYEQAATLAFDDELVDARTISEVANQLAWNEESE